MAVHAVTWEGADTTRGPSASVWGRFPVRAIQDGTIDGAYLFDDFTSFNKTPATTEGNWAAGMGYAQFSDTGGTITSGTGTGGEIVLASDDDNEGASIRTLAVPFKLIQGGYKFAAEVRLKFSTIANTTFEAFWGLMENTALTAAIPITTTAATLADKNLVGFYRTESAGSTVLTTYKADGITAVVVQDAAVTIVAATYIKLGMKYEPDRDKDGQYALSFYQNGTRLTSSKLLPSAAGTDFPNDIALGPVVAVRNAAGTSPGTLTVDWWRYGQVYSPG